MSLELLNENYLKMEREENPLISNDPFNLTPYIIPFSDFFQKSPRLDAYTGLENIPFEERDSEYKKILLTEFL
ncbi:MAG: hypothetical protein KGD67_06740 [Candidatus Lokiarchaeota archaeon]|nr:hypothetical protein [Candidatus Lokiarchaeota archaeon]